MSEPPASRLSTLRRWPPRPSTVVVLVVVGLGLVGAVALALGVVDSPAVPDAAIPLPEGVVVVGDVSLPEGQGNQASATSRTLSVADPDRTAEQLFDAVVAELEAAGWQLEPGPLGVGQVVSTNEVEGVHDLDARLRSGADGEPVGVRTPPWEPGEPYVSISVIAGDPS